MPTRMSSDDYDRIFDRVDGPRTECVLFDQLGDPLPKKWLIDGVIAEGEFASVFGEPGSGKGNFALDLAMHLATGRTWHGRNTQRTGVLYLALERREQVARRVQAFVRHHDVPTSNYLDINLAISSQPIDLRRIDALTRAWVHARWELFEDGLHEQPDDPELGLIVVDTFARAIGDGSDASDVDQNAVAAAVEAFTRETNCAVLIVHHSPVGGEPRLRGHGALHGALDKTIHVKRSRGHFIAKTQKDNDVDLADRMSFEFETKSVVLHVAGDGAETTAPVVVPLGVVATAGPANDNTPPQPRLAPSQAAVLACLTRPSTIEEWRAASDRTAGVMGASGKRKRFTRALAALSAAGLVESDGTLFWPKRDNGTSGTEDTFSSCPAPLSPERDNGTGTPPIL